MAVAVLDVAQAHEHRQDHDRDRDPANQAVVLGFGGYFNFHAVLHGVMSAVRAAITNEFFVMNGRLAFYLARFGASLRA
ncbi:hypothetical protein ACVWZA_000222 [Sphingomonas sp. UYAg733]